MHDRYAKDGFEVLAVTLDKPDDKGARAEVLKFLSTRKASFQNVNLDPKSFDPKKQLREFGERGVPVIYVFNRDNLYVKKLPLLDDNGEEKEEVDYDVLEKVVAGLMKK